MSEYISLQSCPNKSCSNHAKIGGDYVAVHDPKQKRFRCRECGKTWSSHYKELYYGLRSEQNKIRRAIDLFKAGIPIRKIAGFVKVSTSTIQRWKLRFKNIL